MKKSLKISNFAYFSYPLGKELLLNSWIKPSLRKMYFLRKRRLFLFYFRGIAVELRHFDIGLEADDSNMSARLLIASWYCAGRIVKRLFIPDET